MSKDLLPRIVTPVVERRLRSHGAILLTGAKGCGKTTTGLEIAASSIRLDASRADRLLVEADPAAALDGPTPRLIDEFQIVPEVWDLVRHEVDRRRERGQFILAGSATPDAEIAVHTGARRVARVAMRTLTLFERGISSGEVSTEDLLAGDVSSRATQRRSVRDLVPALVSGGWPTHLGDDVDDAMDANAAAIELAAEVDIRRVDGVARDPETVHRLIKGYARNTATAATLKAIARGGDAQAAESTVHDHLAALRRLFLIEDQPAWSPALRSRVRLAKSPKRHLADPSLAAAALGADVDRLLGPEIELLGFLFESQVVHDLRVYSQPLRADVRHYRDNTGLEVDAIVEDRRGRWIGIEVKLGTTRLDAAAANLLKLRGKVGDAVADRCGALVVVASDTPTYVREDGVVVTSVAALGP